jgi:hypothetical protein
MFEPHEGRNHLAQIFDYVYNRLASCDSVVLNTASGKQFSACAGIAEKGPHAGEKVILFSQDGTECARAYECCWGHYYNCDRTRIGVYCSALDTFFHQE